MYHPSKGEGEDPCDTIHGVPDRCRGREDMQKPKPGRNTPGINTDKLLRPTDMAFLKTYFDKKRSTYLQVGHSYDRPIILQHKVKIAISVQ